MKESSESWVETDLILLGLKKLGNGEFVYDDGELAFRVERGGGGFINTLWSVDRIDTPKHMEREPYVRRFSDYSVITYITSLLNKRVIHEQIQ